MGLVYYEDIELNHKISIGEYYVDKEEMIEFSKKWDVRPFHIDEESAKSHPNGGLFAPLTYTMAIVTRLRSIRETPLIAYLAGLGFEKVQVFKPVRPGDRLVVTEEQLEKRKSRTNPARGIVRTLNEVKNQNDELCVSLVSLALVSKRPG
ncbi:MaoC/PaaZ C-terminal domain-containing protein [Chloroflexota bacterium]